MMFRETVLLKKQQLQYPLISNIKAYYNTNSLKSGSTKPLGGVDFRTKRIKIKRSVTWDGQSLPYM